MTMPVSTQTPSARSAELQRLRQELLRRIVATEQRRQENRPNEAKLRGC
jgi:hypothetical protein